MNKKTFKESLNEVKNKQFKKNKIKQDVLILHDPTITNQKLLKQANRQIYIHMLLKNLWYYLKLFVLSIIVLYLALQPYLLAGNYVETAFTYPFKRLTNGQLQQMILVAQGRYLMAAAVFAVALWWVLKRPWNQAPYHKKTVDDFVSEQYPKIKQEQKTLKARK